MRLGTKSATSTALTVLEVLPLSFVESATRVLEAAVAAAARGSRQTRARHAFAMPFVSIEKRCASKKPVREGKNSGAWLRVRACVRA
eukprot:3232641-Pleurochrysis_carterae.AAC.1